MKVPVYEDPITREHPEGEATFLEWASEPDSDDYRSAWVRFDGEDEPPRVFRTLDPSTVRGLTSALVVQGDRS